MLMPSQDGHACTNLAESRDHLHGTGAIEALCQSVMVDSHPDISTWTATDLQWAQEQDKDIHPVIIWLEKSVTKPCWEKVALQSETTKAYWAQWDSLKLYNGVLYCIWENATGDKITKQLVIPKDLRPSVLHLLHNLPTSGHMGVAKTTGRVRERFYWSTEMCNIGVGAVMHVLPGVDHLRRFELHLHSTTVAHQWSGWQLMCWDLYQLVKMTINIS